MCVCVCVCVCVSLIFGRRYMFKLSDKDLVFRFYSPFLDGEQRFTYFLKAI